MSAQRSPAPEEPVLPDAMLSVFTKANPDNLLGRETYANGRVIERYDDITVVRDPNVDIFNKEARLALLAELQAQAAPPAADLDLNAVNERLQEASSRASRPRSPSEASTISAPSHIDEEEALRTLRGDEQQHREMLINDGCPPCHPPEYIYPFDTEDRKPKPYPAAMYFLVDQRSTPLIAQWYEWESFRNFQKRKRAKYQRLDDAEHWMQKNWIGDGQHILRKHGYGESASLQDWSLDVSKQSRLQNWIEFQVWSLLRKEARIRLADFYVRGEVGEELAQLRRANEDRGLKMYDGMLDWIEEQRVTLTAEAGLDRPKTHPPQDEPQGSSQGAAESAAIASALSGRRRSLRTRNRAATPSAQQTASPAKSTTRSKTRGRTRVTKEPARHTTPPRPTRTRHRPQQAAAHEPALPQKPSTGGAAAAQPEKPCLRGTRQSARTAQPKKDAGPRAAASSARNGGKHRVTKAADRQRQQKPQKQIPADTPPVYTRSGRQIRKPDRPGML